ncbi:MAG: threonine synthase, partial [Bradyrhizobium sp.]
MAFVAGLQCVRCGSLYPPDHYAEDCPQCRPDAPSNLAVAYDPSMLRRRDKPGPGSGRGLWRYGDVLPVDQSDGVSLGEGGSPLHRLERVGHAIGLAHLF